MRYQLKKIIFLQVLLLQLVACLKGPGVFKKDGDASDAEYAIISTKIENGVSGAYNAALSGTQVLSALSDSEIAGSSVAFPSGALSIDNTITLEEGSSLASAAAAKSFGVNSLKKGGPAVVLSSSIAVDASVPFTMSIPRSSGSSLWLDSEDDRLVVIYRVYRAAEKQYYSGVFTKDQLSVSSSGVSFKTYYFGSYQVAISDTVIATAVEEKTSAPILTKTAEAKLLDPEWSFGSPNISADARTVAWLVKAENISSLISCVASVYENDDETLVSSSQITSTTSLKQIISGTGYTFSYKAGSNAARTLFLGFSCIDDAGRSFDSQVSNQANLPAKTEEEDEETPVLAIVGYGAPSTTASSRRINFGTSNMKTISGTCDPASSTVYITSDVADSVNGQATATCLSTGTFSFTLNTSSNSGEIILDPVARGYGIIVSQTGQTTVKTVIFNIPGGSSLNVISTKADLAALSSGSGYHVLGADIVLDNAFVPISNFSGMLDGDGHAISNYTRSITGTVSNQGLFGYANSIMLGHFTMVSPAISSAASAVDSVGFVVGNASSCSACIIAGVHVTSGTMNLTGTGATYIGGIVGQGASGLTILDSSATLTITSADAIRVGGIAGSASGLIARSWSGGSLSVKSEVGGLVGYGMGSVLLSHSSAAITASRSTGAANAGGLVGTQLQGSIDQSYATGDVTTISASTTYVGGLVGFLDTATINDSYATGNANGGSKVGGLVGGWGSSSGTAIDKSYASGNATGSGPCGGLIGYAAGLTAVLTNSFATGTAGCATTNGGVIGHIGAAFTSSPPAAVATTQSGCVGSGSITCSTSVPIGEFSDASSAFQTSAGWDFSQVWDPTSPLPTLKHN